MWVVQISDVHINNKVPYSINPNEILKLMCASIRETIGDKELAVVVFCGDAVYKGLKGDYPTAISFFQSMRKQLPTRIEFCLCPGNHDICEDESNYFEGFNQLAWTLTRDSSISFSIDKTVVLRTISDVDFILVNSAYHRDHKYGLVKIEDLQNAIEKSSKPTKFIVIHHNFLSLDRKDRSSIANAYPVLQLAVSRGVRGIFHGHCHLQSILGVGRNSCYLIGVGPLLFPPETNLNNQFNLIHINGDHIENAFAFRLIKDINDKGRTAGFAMTEINFM